MMELDLRLGPRQGDRTLIRHRIVMLVREVERRAARWRDQRPECDAHGRSTRQPHAATKTKDRVEHGTRRVGQWPAVNDRDRRSNPAPAPEEAGAVRLELHIPFRFAFDDGDMGGPDRDLVRRSRPARREQGAGTSGELGLHEQFGERGMRGIGGVGRQDDLGV